MSFYSTNIFLRSSSIRAQNQHNKLKRSTCNKTRHICALMIAFSHIFIFANGILYVLLDSLITFPKRLYLEGFYVYVATARLTIIILCRMIISQKLCK